MAKVTQTSGFLGARLLFFYAVLLVFSGKARADGPVFNKITTNHGLSHNTVYAITQDNKGFMWFGTREGLNRYDGSTVVTFYANPHDSSKLASNVITALEVGPDGKLYIGTSSGLQLYDDFFGVFRSVRFNKSSIGHVNRILRTSDGTLLIGGKNGLFSLKNGQWSLTQLKGGFNIVDIVEFKKGAYWVCTLQKMFMINEHGQTLREYPTLRNASNQPISVDQNMFCLFKDSSGDLWLGTKKDGLFKYDTESDSFKPVVVRHKFNPLEVNAVRAISEDPDKRLWIGTESGLFVYDRKGSFQHFTQSFDGSPATLSDKAIYDIYRSDEGVMWIGTYFGGVNIVKPHEKGFYTLKSDGGNKKLSGKAISDIIQDKYDNIWIATEDGGVNIWNRKTGSISYLKSEVGKRGLSVNNVHCIYEDENDIFWIGTFLGGINRYNLKDKAFKVYSKSQEEVNSFPSNMVYAIHKDRNGELWVGTTVGLNKFDQKSGTYESFKPQVFKNKFIYDIYEERSGGLWICVMESDSLYHYNPMTDQLRKFRYYDSAFSASNGFISALEDSNGQMWFGTINRGLLKFDQSSGRFTAFRVEQGLPNNYVYGILEDSHGNLWMSTNKGLSKFNVKEQRFSNYDISHGLPDNQFNFKSAFKDRDGWMYFGTINGLCYFHPDSLMENNSGPTTYLSDLKLFNKSVRVEPGGILERTIDNTDEITLRYADNVITLEFGAIGFYSSGNNKYAYYLEGFEQGWNYVQAQNNATYTNLSPGSYTFRVKAANNDGFWSNNIRELDIVVLPPFWLSRWAIMLYGLVVAGLFVLYRTFLNYRNKEKMAVQLERLEREKQTEINQHKLNFFTYISHEFKTPLTLIIASIDKFLQDRSPGDEQNAGYWSIRRSAKRLHFLIEQLMEFRRVETDHAQVNYGRGDIILFLQDTFMAFAPLFNKKQIDYYFNTDTTAFHTYFDADKVEKIITNLLSNAAKYTEERGVIEMEVSVRVNPENEPDSIKMIISDSGVGMEPEELENVFTVFYQTDNGRKSGTGTGIGLALVKGLIDFLNGSLEIESTRDTGTQITLSLPLPKHVTNGRIAVIAGNRSIDIEHVLPLGHGSNGQSDDENGLHRECQMMIVEDSEELIDFLGDHFAKNYKIVKAGNGVVALDKIKKSAPDIIISDVMMPDMDGIELCHAVRSDITVSHIPFILLTAKNAAENRLDGLDAGADAYLAKPFSMKELQLIVKNLISTRDILRNHFLQFGSVKDIDVSFTNRDQDFILKLTRIVEEHLDNPEFNITLFAQEACVSRSLLHLKLKKLANLSASEFIRHIRLQKAAELLVSTDHPVADVAYKVGYADSKYFSRSFKEKYQVNPTEYKQAASKDA